MWGSIICFFGGIAVGTLLAYLAEAIDYYNENKIRSNGKKKGRKWYEWISNKENIWKQNFTGRNS